MSFLDKIRELFGHCHKHPDHATVVVQEDDSLWKIAKRITGDGMNWTKIADMNPDLKNVNIVKKDDVLKIPLDWVE